MPTPDSGSTCGNGGKRRRTDNYTMAQSQIYEHARSEHEDGEHDDDDDDDDGDDGVETPSQLPSQPLPELEEEGDLRWFNPYQPEKTRKALRANMRENHRKLDGGFSTSAHVG
jgi:hypothetical protein